MPTVDRRFVLDSLDRDELVSFTREFEFQAPSRASKDKIVEMLADNRRITVGQMLMTLPRKRLKELCRRRGLDYGGREKALIVTRLLGLDPAAPPRPKAVPPIRRRKRV